MNRNLVEIQHLNKSFPLDRNKKLRAVRDVSFCIRRGETVGLVGESGCGKTSLGKCLVQLYQPTSGTILYDGKSLGVLPKSERLAFSKKVQMIFQSTYASLNPVMTVRDIVAEGICLHRPELSPEETDKEVRRYLGAVGLSQEHMSRYPHEFSGGQCQRIGIARALAVEPEFIVCDEPVSALDVSVQAQILNILRRLKEDFNLTLLFISHDLNVVKYISDRVLVMYLGEIVEEADTESLFATPMHPYTEMLFSSIPIADPIRAKKDRKSLIKGEVPDTAIAETGCLFASRCPYAIDLCHRESPRRTEVFPDHFVSCHRCHRA